MSTRRGAARHLPYEAMEAFTRAGSYRGGLSLPSDARRKAGASPAELVHHKKPIREGGKPFDAENLEAICFALPRV